MRSALALVGAAVAVAVCVAALASGAHHTQPEALDAGVPYPSSAAYDSAAGVLVVGSYDDGSVRLVDSGRTSVRAAPRRLPDDGRTHVLRVRTDVPRHRIWVLASDALYLYDARSSQLERRFPIDALAQHSSEHCLPDMAVDRHGNAFVSSAIAPELFRIDATSLELSKREIRVDADEDKDFGFSAITVAGDGETLYAASAMTGALWKIDRVRNTAAKMNLSQPIWGACALRLALSAPASGPDSAALYVAGGFRDGVKRVDLSVRDGAHSVTTVQTAFYPAVPTDFVSIDRRLLVVSSQLSEHPDFNGGGQPKTPFRILALRTR